MTPQREQVLAAVRQLGHATPEQISEPVTGVDVTTVYRTLELLEELGLVRHAHLGHGAPSYRPAEDEHIHVVCHACGSVVDADPALVDAARRPAARRPRVRPRPIALHRVRPLPRLRAEADDGRNKRPRRTTLNGRTMTTY